MLSGIIIKTYSVTKFSASYIFNNSKDLIKLIQDRMKQTKVSRKKMQIKYLLIVIY